MKKVELYMEDFLYEFYRKIGLGADRSAEQVINDMLFRFAGEASLQAIDKKNRGH